MKIETLEKLIRKNPTISRESYNLLIENYKAYDKNQKKLLIQAYYDVNNLSKKVEKLKTELNEYKELLKNRELSSILSILENYDRVRTERNYYKRQALLIESLWITSQFPQYDNIKISNETKLKILELLETELTAPLETCEICESFCNNTSGAN